MNDYSDIGLSPNLQSLTGPVSQKNNFISVVDFNADRNLITRYFTKPSTWVDAVDGTTVTFDLSKGTRQRVTLGGNRTMVVVNGTVGQTFIVRLKQDGTGSRTVTWFDTISWAGGGVPTLTTTANKVDVFGFLITDINTYDGFILGINI